MAPATESAYLPSLAACLDGNSKVLSWRRIASGLDANALHPLDKSVAKYISDPLAIQVLTNCFKLTKSTSQTKAEFESLTSAINVTPTSNDRYDIKELKEDSLWLSQAVQIDEVLALRHAVLEWQSRLGRLAAMNLQETDVKDFNTAKCRRQRLLVIHFEEQQWLFRCVEIIVARGVYGPSGQTSATSSDDPVNVVAENLSQAWNLGTPSTSKQGKAWLASPRQYLQSQMDIMTSGTNLISRDEMQDYATEALYSMCIETSIVQIMHGLQIILLIQRSFPGPSNPQIVTEWFSWMDATAFFGSWSFQIPAAFVHYRSLAAELLILNSLAFIDIAASWDILPDLATTSAASNGQDVKIYLQNIRCITELNRIIGDHIEAQNEVAAPVAVAWCSLLNTIHIHASQSVEYRENRQAQKAIEFYGANQQSDNESLDGSTNRRRTSPNRRHSFGSDTSGQATLFEEIDEIARNHPMGEDAVKHFGTQAAEELGAFSIVESIARNLLSRIAQDISPDLTKCIQEILVQFIKICYESGSLNYSPLTLNILFTILSGRDGHWKFGAQGTFSAYSDEGAYQPLGEDVLLREFMTSARGRFPYEGVPFIELCRTLLPYQDFTASEGDLMFDVLSDMATYTTLVIEPQMPYDLIEDGDKLRLRLLESENALAMTFPSLLYYLPASAEGELDSLLVPAGTMGHPLREEKPVIALWNFNYSALRLCGSTLQLQLQWRAGSRAGDIVHELARLQTLNTEIIALLATWIVKITSVSNTQASSEKAQALLANMSDDLDRNQDVVAVIFTLLEGHLYKNRPDALEASFIFRCMQFLVALAKVMPGRVWSFLSRSGLLGLNGQENRLTAIVTAAEMSTGSYDILLTSIQLLNVLVEDSIRSPDMSRSTSFALKRFRATENDGNGSGAQKATISAILDQFTKIIIDVIETSSSWTFKSEEHELSLKLGIYTILHKIITYSFNYDDESLPARKLSTNLAQSANYILDNFLSSSTSDTLLSPLFQELIDAIVHPATSFPSRVSNLRHSVARSSLELSAQLVRLNKFLKRTVSVLAKKICVDILVFVNLFVLHHDLRLSVVHVLDAVIRDVGSDSQPGPVLAALSESSAKAFLQSLATLGLSDTDSLLSASTWSLFSAAVTSHQQWVTVYLLLGKSPKESLKDSSSPTIKPILSIALKRVADVEKLHPEEASRLLEFVANSANVWTSVTLELKNDKDCRRACLEYLSALQLPKKDNDIDATVPARFQIASYIVNILAILVHQSNQHNDTTTPKHLVPSITYLVEHGVSSPHYNAALHHGLQKNFEAVFPGSNLQHFKKTAFSQPRLGSEFYYDKALADTILHANQAWSRKAGSGFANEFSRANINLSLVEAQVNLFHSWKVLAMELAEGLSGDSSFQITMISIIKNCLEANQGSTMPEAIFRKLCISRADLAFTLLQKLLDIRSGNEELKIILHSAWSLVQSRVTDFGTTLIGEDADYARTLLRILYLALCAHEDRAMDTTSVENSYTAIALDILESVVAQGFRSLIGQLHQNSGQVQPGDFALIIAILRASLKLRGVANHSERLLAHFADEKTIQHAGTLVSWSDQLAVNGDPVYGELSIMFLLELSAIQVLAEAIIVNGTLSQISSTTLFSYFRRKGGCGPFDTPLRVYNIWSRGYLPLTLNIMGAVGAPVVIEIGTMFGQFAPQLKRASLQFDPKSLTAMNSRVTLSMINETHSLALLNVVLNRFREAGSQLGIISTELPYLEWDTPSVKEDLESLLGRRHTLRESIAPVDEQEDNWFQQIPLDGNGGAQTRLEERIVAEIHAALALMGNTEP